MMTWMMVSMSGLALISRQGLPTRLELLRQCPTECIIASTNARQLLMIVTVDTPIDTS
jgi:hypothetical protein